MLAATLASVLISSASAAQGTADYDIDVRLDSKNHTLAGNQQLRWTNNTSQPAADLWLHLYLNAFANPETTLMSEYDDEVDSSWGWIRITRLEDSRGTDLLPALEFVQPDDGNVQDLTVARLPLPEAVPPTGSVELVMEFEAQLPWLVRRSGYSGDFHMVAQWFPKVAVFEDVGFAGNERAGWSCHQYHNVGEFYADFGSYRVAVTVPDGWVVGATGIEVHRADDPDDPAADRLLFRADNVHDFAWVTAPPSLLSVVEAGFDPETDVPKQWLDRNQELLGLSPAELELPPIHLRLLVPTTQLALVDRMLRAARLGIAWHGLRYGPYPHPQLTIVSPPAGASYAAGGMEYPTLITTGATILMAYPPLRWHATVESLTVHEMSHQYFQGLLASNEALQGWLDEGLATYSELTCIEEAAADNMLADLRFVDVWNDERQALLAWKLEEHPDQPAWTFRNETSYYRASYTRAALALRTLEGLIGKPVVAQALRTYVSRFRNRHPTGDDLVAVLSETADRDLGWFFDQAIHADVSPDWAVLEVDQQRTGDHWEVAIDIGRKGEFAGPVKILAVLADGTRHSHSWNGRARWTRWHLRVPARVDHVVVDPEVVWALEVHRRDNYWRHPAAPSRSDGPLWWVRPALQLFGLATQAWS